MKRICLIIPVLVFVTLNISISGAQNAQFIGMTNSGGTHSCGTIFKMNADGSGFQTVYSFDSLTGMNPYGSLLQASDGNLYGMAFKGKGNAVYGILFSFDPVSNIYNALHYFNKTDGASPYGSLMEATDGNLYGMTYGGGTHTDGVIFKYSPSGNAYAKLFDLADSLGVFPKGDLLQASDGKLYGMTSAGGNNFNGTLFSFDPVNTSFTKKVDFTAAQGSISFCDLTEVNDMLYGTTRLGGTNNAGVIFRYDIADNSFSKLLDFAGGNQQGPAAGLKSGGNGKLYGMTVQGGANNKGCVYSFDTAGNIYAVVQDFDSINGASPQYNTLMQALDGKLYGMTVNGGADNDGVIFSYDPAGGTFVKLHDFSGANGKNPYGALLELKTTTPVIALKNKINFTVYPDPVQDELRIEAGLRIVGIEIYDMLGKETSPPTPLRRRGEQAEIDVSTFAAGIYFISIIDNADNIYKAKFIKN